MMQMENLSCIPIDATTSKTIEYFCSSIITMFFTFHINYMVASPPLKLAKLCSKDHQFFSENKQVIRKRVERLQLSHLNNETRT